MARVAFQANRPTVREEPATKKVRLRKNSGQRSLLDIDADLLAKVRQDYGADLQWVTDSVLGQAAPGIRSSFEVNAWEPVTQDMFGGIFNGLFMKKDQAGEILMEGLVLMWRPYELTEEARAEERAARDSALAAQQNMIKGGQIPGMSAGFEPDHPTAIQRNVFRRAVEIPKD